MCWWFAVACPAPETTEPVETGMATSGETGVAGPTLTAACAPTDNALRFTCHVTVDPPQPVQVSFAASDGVTRVHTSDASAAEHDVVLYFMREDTAYTWTAAPKGASTPAVTGEFRSGEVPADIESEMTVEGTSAVPYVGTHDPCHANAVAVVYDTVTGELVWYSAVNDVGNFGFLNMIRFTEDHTILGETGAAVVEIDLTGAERLRLSRGTDYEEDLHHDLNKKDGLYYLLFHDGFDPLLDGILVVDGAGQRLATWRALDTLPIPYGAAGDWMHTNTIILDDAGDWYLSSFEQDTVLKVEGDWNSPLFGSLVWALAGSGPKGFGQDFTVDWSGVGVAGFAEQHDLQLTGAGELVMLDNANGRVLVFALDEAGRQATAVGEYGTGVEACGPQGTAHRTAGGNTFAACSGRTLREYTAQGDSVWSGELVCGGGFTSAVRFYPLEGW